VLLGWLPGGGHHGCCGFEWGTCWLPPGGFCPVCTSLLTTALHAFTTTTQTLRRYPGHLNEEGLNALHFNQVANSWIKDVRFVNADTGIYMWGTAFNTVQDVDVDTTK
jgi:hypothetical protein